MIVPRGNKLVHKSTAIPTVNVSVPKAWEYYQSNGTFWSQSAPGPTILKSSGLSDIAYTTRAKGSNVIHSNFCVHRNNRYVYNGDPLLSQVIIDKTSADHNWYYKYWNGHSISSSGHVSSVAAARTAVGVATDQYFLYNGAQAWINSAAARTKPDLNAVDGVNFALQINDLRNLYFAWTKGVPLVKNLASNYLALKFGLLPDIGDLQAAAKMLLDFKHKLESFQSFIGQEIRTRTNLVATNITKFGSVVPAGSCLTYWHGSLDQEVNAFIYYRPLPILALNDIDRTIRGLMSVGGVELNPRIVWDAIPFTFVVDWFVNIGKILERYKLSALELPIVYTDSFLQYKSEFKVETRTALDINSAVSSSTNWPGGTTTEKVFVRYPILPDYPTLADLKFRLPGPNQAVLTLALGAVLLL